MKYWDRGPFQIYLGPALLGSLGNSEAERARVLTQKLKIPNAILQGTVVFNLDCAHEGLRDWEILLYWGLRSIRRSEAGNRRQGWSLLKDLVAFVEDSFHETVFEIYESTNSLDMSETYRESAWRHVHNRALAQAGAELSTAYLWAYLGRHTAQATHIVTDWLSLTVEVESDVYSKYHLNIAQRLFDWNHAQWSHDLYRAHIAYNLGTIASTVGEDLDDISVLRISQWFLGRAIENSTMHAEMRTVALIGAADASINLGEYDTAAESLRAARELLHVGGITQAELHLLEVVDDLQQVIFSHYRSHGNCDCGRSGHVPVEAKSFYVRVRPILERIKWLGVDILVNSIASLVLRRPVGGIRLQVVFGKTYKGVQIGERNTQIIHHYQYTPGFRQMFDDIVMQLTGGP